MKNDKIWLFVDDANAVPLRELKQRANGVRSLLDGHGKDLGKLLQRKFEYKTVSTEEYLVELPKDKTKCVKKDWELINQTTKVKRYRTPFIIEQMHELAMIQETMQAEADLAWKTYLGKFASEYDVFRRVVEHLAELDCLLAFAIIAQQPNFCKPTILQQEETLVKIVNGRNPVVTALADDMSFVPNDTHLGNGTDGQRCYVITGPNMGGKSCYIRQVALMSIMAQVGCYVPADAATVTPLDAVYTRMGAEDNIFARESTFMYVRCHGVGTGCALADTWAHVSTCGRTCPCALCASVYTSMFVLPVSLCGHGYVLSVSQCVCMCICAFWLTVYACVHILSVSLCVHVSSVSLCTYACVCAFLPR